MQLIEAMQRGLGQLVGRDSGYIDSLPKLVKQRIGYLEKLQIDYDELEEALEEKIKALEKEFRPAFGKQSTLYSSFPIAYFACIHLHRIRLKALSASN